VAKSSRRSRNPRPRDPSLQRINKVLASAGLGSRREVEELVVQGRVEVDREIITDLAFRLDPTQSKIKVDGELLRRPKLVYIALNKPPGVLSTNSDPSGRMRVIDLIPEQERVFSVGRLDKSSQGLILLTNDGDLAQRLAHPKYRVQKTYFVVVAGNMTTEELAKLRKGVYLAEGIARIDGATIRRNRKGCTELEIVLSEGKNREIRRILARAGHKVVLLRRIAIGNLRLGQLPVGASRMLTGQEVKALYALSKATKKSVQRAEGQQGEKASAAKSGRKQSVETTSPPARNLASPPKEVRPGKPTVTPLDTVDATSSDHDLVGSDAEFQVNDDELVLSAEQVDLLENESQAFEEYDDEFADAYDDDFVGGFGGEAKFGSVIGSEDDEGGFGYSSDTDSKADQAKSNRQGRQRSGRRGSADRKAVRGSSGARGRKRSPSGRSKQSSANAGGSGSQKSTARGARTGTRGARTGARGARTGARGAKPAATKRGATRSGSGRGPSKGSGGRANKGRGGPSGGKGGAKSRRR